AGSVALFASLYAAHALYSMLGSLAAFVLLALVAAATVLLSLLHGVFMAWLGIAGAYAVPLIVTTPHPSIAGLLGYAAIVAAGSTALMRWRGWIWLAWLALGFALVLSAVFMGLAWRFPRVDRLAWIGALLQVSSIAGWCFPAVPGPEIGRLHLLMVPPTSGTGSYLAFAAALGIVYGLGG